MKYCQVLSTNEFILVLDIRYVIIIELSILDLLHFL